jgi:uncharacterized protein (TIGR02271 family)
MLKNLTSNQDKNQNSEISKQLINNNDSKIQLHEEQLNIAKKWAKTGEVSIRKEVFIEEKIITVPITREELIIEKKVLDNEVSNEIDSLPEIIRIPISEERIEIIKHPVTLEDVSIYKRQFEETKSIEKTLKKEKLHIETTGNTVVIDKENCR